MSAWVFRRAAFCVALAAAAAAGPLAPGDATAAHRARSWSAPQMLLGPRHPVQGVQVAAGPNRYAVAIWTSGHPKVVPLESGSQRSRTKHRVFASIRQPGARRFGRHQPISPPGVRAPAQLGMSADGQTVVTWSDAEGRVQARFSGPGERFGESQTVSPTGVPTLAVGHDGTAIATWIVREDSEQGLFGLPIDGLGSDSSQRQTLVAAVRAPNGRFGTPQELPQEEGERGVYTAIAAGSRGFGGIAHSGTCEPEPAHDASVWFVRADRSPPRREVVPNSACPAWGMSMAIDDQGGAVVLIDGQDREIRAAAAPPGGPFAPAEPITPTAGSAELGMDRSGGAVATWSSARSGIEASMRSADGVFGRPAQISGARRAGFENLAVSARGAAVAVWEQRRDPRGAGRLWAAYLPAGARRFGKPARVSPALSRTSATLAQAAVNASGRALLVGWGGPGRRGDAGARGVFVAEGRGATISPSNPVTR